MKWILSIAVASVSSSIACGGDRPGATPDAPIAGAAADAGACPLPSLGDFGVNMYEYAGTSHPACPLGYPEAWPFRILDVRYRNAGRGGAFLTHYDTTFDALLVSTVEPAPCAVTFAFHLPKDIVTWKVGDELTVSARASIWDPERDTRVTWVFRDPRGRVLMAYAIGAYPSTFDGDLLGGLQLRTRAPSCPFDREWAPTVSELVTSGEAACSGTYGSDVTCTLWQDTYRWRLFMSIAHEHSPPFPPNWVGFLLHTPETTAAAPAGL